MTATLTPSTRLPEDAIYREIVESTPGNVVTIRTLDIGGDKTVPYLGHRNQEANPFMGWRSIRLSFEHPEFFSTQIRAVLRAAVDAERHGVTLRVLSGRAAMRRAETRHVATCRD